MTANPSLNERLGYAPDARLLIVTSDDLGFTHAVNAAFMAAIDDGVLTSGSVMVPCPWFAEIAAFGRSRPDVDLGIHLTVTSECDTYRWGPVLGRSAVPSLVDRDGAFPRTEDELLAQADLTELEAELRAQVAAARSAGLKPTHLDNHMGVLDRRADVYNLLLRIGLDEGLPVRHPREWRRDAPYLDEDPLVPQVVQNDHIRSPGEDLPAKSWEAFYESAVTTLEPGVTELVLHVGVDTPEVRAAYGAVEAWGAAWRQRDFDAARDPSLARAIADGSLVSIGWRALAELAADAR